MDRIIARLAALAFVLAPGAALAQAGQTLEQQLDSIQAHPPDPKALQAAGEALIAASGDPARLAYVPDKLMIGLKDTKSGLRCRIPLGLKNVTVAFKNGGFECSYNAAINEEWRAFPLEKFNGGALASPDAFLLAFMQHWMKEDPKAEILPAKKSSIEASVEKLLQPPQPYLLRRLGLPSRKMRLLFGVKDLNGWRYVYFAAGAEDPIESLAPMAFISGIADLKDAPKN